MQQGQSQNVSDSDPNFHIEREHAFWTIYHNLKARTSVAGLKLLKDAGIEPKVIDYMKAVAGEADGTAHHSWAQRRSDHPSEGAALQERYATLRLNEYEWVEGDEQNPELIERPSWCATAALSSVAPWSLLRNRLMRKRAAYCSTTTAISLLKTPTDMDYRIEKDTMGEVKVPADKYWGAQTERSRNNFKIGPPGSMPREIVHAFAYLKKAAALTNLDGKLLEKMTSPRATPCSARSTTSSPSGRPAAARRAT